MSKFVKFPSIEKFSDVNVMVKRAFDIESRPTVTYRGKVKLHGTCAGIRVDADGTIVGQKRTADVSIGDDNAGFAAWLENAKKDWTPIKVDHIVYGEWAGPGVQKTVAVSQIEKKSFFPFAVYFPESNYWAFRPATIEKYVVGLPDTYVLPWATEDFTVDFRLQSSMERFTSDVAVIVDQCDKSDPFIKEKFGIDGIGEGYVFYPTDDWLGEAESHKYITQYLFKAKGESHSNSKVSKFKTIVPVDPVIASSVDKFVAQFVTEARCEQGLTEACGGEASMANLGKFMGWIGSDVKKESVNELAVSNLEWKDVGKAVNTRAKDWFVLKIEKKIEEMA